MRFATEEEKDSQGNYRLQSLCRQCADEFQQRRPASEMTWRERLQVLQDIANGPKPLLIPRRQVEQWVEELVGHRLIQREQGTVGLIAELEQRARQEESQWWYRTRRQLSPARQATIGLALRFRALMNSFLRRLAGLITHGKDRSLDEDLRVIRGIAASPGTVTGRAKVGGGFRRRERPTETPTLQPGEVLVCEVALWGWRPLFSTATAVVTDSGGILSIAAIIARETGIPGPT